MKALGYITTMVAATSKILEGNPFTAPVYLGPDLFQLDVIWDTGSPKSWLPISTCTDCTGKTYDKSSSETAGFFSVLDVTPVTSSFPDGTAFTGVLVQDKVCLDSLSCANSIKWYAINSETGIPISYDRIIGLGVGNDPI